MEQTSGRVSYSVYAREDGRTRFTLIDADTGNGKAADMPTAEAHRMFFFGWATTMQPRTVGGNLLQRYLLRRARAAELRRN